MHARVGIYQVKPGTLDDTIAKARAELLPMMREQEGLMRYTVVRTGPDSFASLSGWETREQAERAAETLSGWMQENVGPSVVSMENHIGEVGVLHGQSSPDKTPQYGMVRVMTEKPGAPDMTEKIRTEFMPLWDRQPGFNSFATMRTSDGKRISFGGWDSREEYEAAQPELRQWGDANVAPQMEKIEHSAGEVVWSVRKG